MADQSANADNAKATDSAESSGQPAAKSPAKSSSKRATKSRATKSTSKGAAKASGASAGESSAKRPSKPATKSTKATTTAATGAKAVPAPPKATPQPSPPAAAPPAADPSPAAAPPPAAPPPAPAAVPSPSVAPGVWASAAWEALQQLDQPPRRLVELAVAELGPRAAGWAGWLRETYPGAPAYGVARLATRQAVRGGLLLALVEFGGAAVAPVRLPAAAWVRATVVLRVAAAYDHDPSDPARVDDLIQLLNLDPSAADSGSLGGLGGFVGAAGQLGLSRFVAGRLGLRRTPAIAVRALVEASDQVDSLERLAHRAERHFRVRSRA